MNVPEWIKLLKEGDEIVLYFPYSANTIYATVNSDSTDIIPYYPGVAVKYHWKGVDKEDFLRYDNYGGDGTSWDHWIAYESNNSGN